ncbi:MAG: hypothetical protein NTX73_04970 [Rhodobacterales bacterium]|nr:hypothetical protein [Rhodobacterales bacterium]
MRFPTPFRAAEGTSGTTTTARVAEVVTFRLRQGITTAEFLVANATTAAILAVTPGLISRNLSAGPDGRWTDHVIWTDQASAQAAAQTIITDPRVAPFMSAIDPEGMDMRHETLHWQQA